MTDKTLTEQLALWADRLRDHSALGLRFASNIYDKQHYRAIQDIAMEMLALLSGEKLEQIEPLRLPHFSRSSPLIGGDAAVIDDKGRILLIQRSDNAMWCMPGGMLEVGELPAEGVMRETLEETGVHCKVKSLIGVFDSRMTGVKMPFHLYSFSFLCEPKKDKPTQVATFAHETLDLGWFAESDLPDPIDPRHKGRIPKAFQMWRHSGEAFFDIPANDT
ncbi:MAG: NUDIX hydrolase N-terminal domain-containing protein [Trueperaceae bacterium]|nr:NUDIX hydrolase N-terminal domain-containing protein [Trueperaceae bacterium]